MSRYGILHDVEPPEDLLARSLALHVIRRITKAWKRRVHDDDILVSRYLAAPPQAGSTVTHDLIVVLAPREISGAICAQVRAFGPAVPPADARHGR